VDESATGSANFFCSRIADVHLRPPSIDRGVTSFLWAFGLGLFIWLGLVAVGVSRGTALVLALISFAGIFLFVRTHGEDV
jgi:peptidoglycan/LPS O-acetylase OafA/YrhL